MDIGLKNNLQQLLKEVRLTMGKLDIPRALSQLAELRIISEKSDFWQDNSAAQVIMKDISKLELKTSSWVEIEKKSQDLIDLVEIADGSIIDEIRDGYSDLNDKFIQQKNDLLFRGEFDDHDAVVSIHAGTGGTDAQDWAGMLLRMYLRYAEKSGFKTQIIDESSGEEAGIKSVTFTVDGLNAYGKMRSEHGVHRLVRLSPFNADALRQTSFAKLEVSPKIDQSSEVEIDEKDLKIDVYRSGGKGGQSVNTTDSAVRITHLPTNIVVAIQNERSQLQNRDTAMTILRSKLAQLKIEQHAKSMSDIKGPNEQASWGNQIRSYVLHPYKMVKDLRTNHETSDTEGVLDGEIDSFITSYLEYTIS